MHITTHTAKILLPFLTPELGIAIAFLALSVIVAVLQLID